MNAPLSLNDAKDLLSLVRGVSPGVQGDDAALHLGVRDLSGSQNNTTNPVFGAANEQFIRLTEARFGAVDPALGTAKINPIFQGLDPRQISNSLAVQEATTAPSTQANIFWMSFAQYFDHGLDFLVKGGNGSIPIGGVGSGGPDNPTDLTRASITGWENGVPQNTNQTSPFVDQNQAYGSAELIGQFLRESNGTGGLGSHLLSGEADPSAPGFQLLPTLRHLLDHHIAAQTIFTGTNKGDITLEGYYPGLINPATGAYDPTVVGSVNANFLGSGYALLVDTNSFISLLDHVVAGDGRVNENVGLSSMHTIWARNHNYHADQLQTIYSEAGIEITAEELFQAAKMVNETEYQRIIFTEFAETMLGSAGIRGVGQHGFSDYQPGTDARISQEFAAMAYRVGHTMIGQNLTVLDADGNPVAVPLFDLFLNPSNEASAFSFDPDGLGPAARLSGDAAVQALAQYGYSPAPGYEQRGVAAILGGLVQQPAEEIDTQMVDAVRNDLVRIRADLAAFNIARGWDLGLGTLNQIKADLQASNSGYVQEALSYVGAESMRPYDSWADFQNRNGLSASEISKFMAAYPDLVLSSADQIASFALVNPDIQLIDNGDGSATVKGIDRVDGWVGGLAEQKFEDSLLGSTFWTIIHEQMDRLQEGDRFYYLPRLENLEFYQNWAENQSFADIVARNTGLTGLPESIFAVYNADGATIGLPGSNQTPPVETYPVVTPPVTDGHGAPTDVVTSPVVVDTSVVDTSKAIHLGLNLHKLPEFDGDLSNDLVLRRFGTPLEQGSQFYLELTAESLRDASIDTLDVTLDLGSDFFDVFQISGQQIFFSEDMAVERQVRIDGTKVRFEGAGLSALGEGLGQGVDSTAPIAVIALKLRDDIDSSIQAARVADRYGFLNSETWQQSLNFAVSANIDQVVFSDLVSLRDLGGEDALMSDELHLMARAAQAELSTASTFGLGTERSVLKPGETGFTNLIRSGDSLERITQWQNDGEFSFRDFTITNIDQDGVAKAVSVFLDNESRTLNTLTPGTGTSNGEVAEIRTTFMVTGEAGSVLDTKELGFQLDALGGYHWDTSKMDLFQQKNLITFQGDLNYDGAVTMKDLAFLNAGAARGVGGARGYSRDVDANFDGELDIEDLAILDADWGRSLHQGQSQFLGSDQLSMASLTGQGQLNWDSSAFQAQNTIEAKETYVNPITDAIGTLVDVQGFKDLEALLQEQQQQYGLN
jgi:hypothetical protein